MGYAGKHRPLAPQPQPWEEAIGVGHDYKPQKDVARLAPNGHEQTEPVYKGFKGSFGELFPEVKYLTEKTKNLVGRLAVWRAGRQAAEQQNIHQAHQALQQVETEITQQQQILPPPGLTHESTPVDKLVLHAGKESMNALNAPTLYLPKHQKPELVQEEDKQDSDDLIGSGR